MKILLIHHRIPHPLTSGMDKVRYNLIQMLAKKYNVTLLSPVDEYTLESSIKHVTEIVDDLITVPVKNRIIEINNSASLYINRLISLIFRKVPTYISNNFHIELAREVKENTEKYHYDIIQPLSSVTSVYFDNINFAKFKILGPVDDTIHSAWTDFKVETNFRKKIAWYFEYLARKAWQPSVCKKADRVFFFSNNDMNNVKAIAGDLEQARVLPVAVEIDGSWNMDAYKKIEKNSIVFVGGLGSLFNQHAVIHFHKNIFPLILRNIPNAKLYIVGQHPPKKIRDLSKSENVVITGFVSDVRPYIEKAAVYVSPIVAGTGLKTKIIEALRFGKAIVSTKAGVQGLWELGDEVISLCEKPEQFANEVVKLLIDDGLRHEKERKARKLFEEVYSFDKVSLNTLSQYEDIERQIYEQK